MEKVVLVDAEDRSLGLMEKMEAHERGALHRAVSVCLFDNAGRWLIQQRAPTKYHSPGLYANSCCSHPRSGESVYDAAVRRVYEELGLRVSLHYECSFLYKADVGSGLIEHEYDHLFSGRYLGPLYPNSDEVCDIVWWSYEELSVSIRNDPHLFAAWFPHIFSRFTDFSTHSV